jgi:hypothetical protein
MGWEPPLPGPLLHKCVEEREKTGGFALHEPAVDKRKKMTCALAFLRAETKLAAVKETDH